MNLGWIFPLIIFFLPFKGYSSEIGISENKATANQWTSTASTFSTGECSAEQLLQNQKILQYCDQNWKNWGISPKPKDSEIRDLKECPSHLGEAVVNFPVAEGCAEAILALPILIADTALMGLLAVAMPEQKNSYTYVSQNGSLQEIKAYLTSEFMRAECEYAEEDLPTYVEAKCPDQQSQLDSEKSAKCRSQALEDLVKIKLCLKNSRTKYRSYVAKLNQEAHEIYRIQQQRKQEEKDRALVIETVKSKCEVLMNPLKGSMYTLLSPLTMITYGATETKNFLNPDQKQVEAFNNCVAREIRNDPDLKQDLMLSGQGFIDQAIGQSSSLQCYNQKQRAEIQCKVAKAIFTGGSSLVVKEIVKKFGKVGAEKVARRLGQLRRSKNIDALNSTSNK